MIRSILARIRAFLEPRQPKTYVKRQDDDELEPIQRYEPIIPEKHFGYGWNVVGIRLEIGGECKVFLGNGDQPFSTEI